MMELGSLSSEPQYQKPDNKNDVISYIPRPLVQPPSISTPTSTQVVPEKILYYLDPNMAGPLFNKFGNGAWIFNRLDFYGNSIILGSICNALAFITYGFYRSKIYKVNDTFLWSVILLFGGIGQITAGFLEYCKGRHFPCTLYLVLGFYCLSHYAYYVIPSHFDINYNVSMYYIYDNNSITAFYAGWTFISFGMILGSVRSNFLYICQVISCFAFFLLRAVGEGCGSLGTKWHAAGILEVISGFFSLSIGISQIINNETCYRMCCPTCPMSPDNEIDMLPQHLLILYEQYLSPVVMHNTPNTHKTKEEQVSTEQALPIVPEVPGG